MKTKSIRHNMVMNMILAASGVVIPLITYPYVTRVFSPEELGKIAFTTNIIFYYRLIAQLGIPTYGIRQCAASRDDKEELSAVTTQLGFINVIMTGLSLLLLAISVILIPKLHNYSVLFAISSIELVFGTLNFEWLYKGLEDFDYITKRTVFCRILIMISTFLFIHNQTDYYLYALFSGISAVLIWVCNIRNVRNIVTVKKKYLQKEKVMVHIKPIVVLCTTFLATTIYTSIDTVMLGLFCGDREVGIYSVAVKIKTVLITLITSMVAVYLPRMSKCFKEKATEQFNKILSEGIQCVITISLPLVVFFYLTSPLCIKIIAGKQYLAAVIPMKILMPTIFLIGNSALLGTQVLVAMGMQSKYLFVTTIAAVVDGVINFILIPKMGAIGAAIGTLVAELLVLILEIYFVRNIFKEVLKKICLYKSLVASGGAFVFAKMIQNVVNMESIGVILKFGLLSIIFGSSYLLILLLLKDNLIMETMDAIKNMLLRRK